MLFVLVTGCAAGDSAPSDRMMELDMEYQGPITLWNRSQFPLDQVRVHRLPSYAGAPNRLSAPLAPGAAVVIELSGANRVTIIRGKVEGGREWAISTPRPVSATSHLFVLVVFDDGFLEASFDEVSALDGFPLEAPPRLPEDDASDDA